jgi:hypothetical protein
VAQQRLRELNHTLAEKTTLLQSREELLKTFVKSVPTGVAMLDCAIESPADLRRNERGNAQGPELPGDLFRQELSEKIIIVGL